MVLVLIALGVGTVLGAAALSSRDNSAAIGANAATLAGASWAAHSGADLAEAILQTEADWLSRNGAMLTDLPLAGGTVSVSVTDLEGNPPDEEDRELILRAVATLGGVQTTVERRISLVPPAPLESVFDAHLNEFAVFATGSLTVEDGAVLGRFERSPDAQSLSPVRVGTGFASVGNLNIGALARLRGVSLCVDANASGELIDAAEEDEAFSSGWNMPVPVPAIADMLPSEFVALSAQYPVGGGAPIIDGLLGGLDGGLFGEEVVIEGSPGAPDPLRSYQDLDILTGDEVVLDGTTNPDFAFSSVEFRGAGVLRVVGSVRLHIRGHLSMNFRGAIELAPGARLTVFLGGNLSIDDAGLGVNRLVALDPARGPGSVSSYASPGRVWIIGLHPASGGSPSPLYALRNRALFMGCIHAPHAAFIADSRAVVIGRVTAGDITLRSDTALLYDLRLDHRRGFASPASPMYDHTRLPIAGVLEAIDGAAPDTAPDALMGSLTTIVRNSPSPLLRNIIIDDDDELFDDDSPLIELDDCNDDDDDDDALGAGPLYDPEGESGSGVSGGGGGGGVVGLDGGAEPEAAPVVPAAVPAAAPGAGATLRDATRVISRARTTTVTSMER